MLLTRTRHILSKCVKSAGTSSKQVRSPVDMRTHSSQSVVPQYKLTDDGSSFNFTFEDFMDDVMPYFRKFDNSLAASWLEKAMRFNIYEKRPYRGLVTVNTFVALADDTQLTPENIELAYYVAWCSKMMEAAVQITDDFIDGSAVRKRRPCWHLLPEVGLQHPNDSLMLAAGALSALSQRLQHKEYYQKLLQTFIEGHFITCLGQTLDCKHSELNVMLHSRELHQRGTELKTGYFGCYMPVAIGMYMCSYHDPILHEKVKAVCYEIARFWTMKNDFLDCFSDSFDIGQTDIAKNKATWMTFLAMDKANKEQMEILATCHGHKSPEKVQQIIRLYMDLGMEQHWENLEKITFNDINNMIEDLPNEKIKPVFHRFNTDVRNLH